MIVKFFTNTFKITLGFIFSIIAYIRHPDNIIMAKFDWFHEPYADSTILDYIWYFCTLSPIMISYVILFVLGGVALKQKPAMSNVKHLTKWIAITFLIALFFHPHGVINIQFDDFLYRDIWKVSYASLLSILVFILLKPPTMDAKN